MVVVSADGDRISSSGHVVMCSDDSNFGCNNDMILATIIVETIS